jgi:uncharacterized protein YdhG (YjbR/CyaY superfamily)
MKTSSTKSAKTKKVKTVDDYLSAVPEPARSTLEKIRSTIRSVVPRESEEVISYGMPAFRHKKVIVWYAAFSDHCSLFPTPAILQKFEDELRGYTISKGTIQFASDKPLPTALLKKIVKARLSQL